jgi:hypothetical protein
MVHQVLNLVPIHGNLVPVTNRGVFVELPTLPLKMASAFIMVLDGKVAQDYRVLCSEYMLRELANYNPLLKANLAAEEAQARSIDEGKGSSSMDEDLDVGKKRRRSIDEDEETAEERAVARFMRISNMKFTIAENMAKAREVTLRVDRMALELQKEVLAGLPDTIHKKKAVAYISLQNTNLSMRICGPTQADNARKMLMGGESVESAVEMPNILYEGQPLLISSVLAQKGLCDDNTNTISKAVGIIASELYREKHGKRPEKSDLILPSNNQVKANGYIEADREILEQAVDEYMKTHDTSRSKTRTQKAKEAAEKESRTQTKLNFGKR